MNFLLLRNKGGPLFPSVKYIIDISSSECMCPDWPFDINMLNRNYKIINTIFFNDMTQYFYQHKQAHVREIINRQ